MVSAAPTQRTVQLCLGALAAGLNQSEHQG